VDKSGNAWIADFGNASVTKISQVGAAAAYLGGGLSSPYSVAIDGAGNVWTVDQNPFGVSELSSGGAVLGGPGGYFNSTLNLPTSVAIDGSGNVWIANNGGNSVSELVGLATPVVTPMVAGLPATPTGNGSSSLGTQP
jgi:hypothetical protein